MPSTALYWVRFLLCAMSHTQTHTPPVSDGAEQRWTGEELLPNSWSLPPYEVCSCQHHSPGLSPHPSLMMLSLHWFLYRGRGRGTWAWATQPSTSPSLSEAHPCPLVLPEWTSPGYPDPGPSCLCLEAMLGKLCNSVSGSPRAWRDDLHLPTAISPWISAFPICLNLSSYFSVGPEIGWERGELFTGSPSCNNYLFNHQGSTLSSMSITSSFSVCPWVRGVCWMPDPNTGWFKEVSNY